ncbi:hypothetical protein MN116_006144 [Schistosoma mekongi]|uniref:Uncharacterized protein n=1 Tax=Schistosoma mekongi TaxID=38744 RepID=A0AAE2D436_SCHME|nr:hypothetical protein MN116_006144 [Schistosoma mekongi]
MKSQFTILVHRIPKFAHNIFTFEMKLMDWINGSYIGRLYLNDENSSTALCGDVQFNIVPVSDCLPIAVDLTTGILRVNSCYGVINNSRSFTFQVTVASSDTPSNISDKAVVNILIGESYSDETTDSEASLDKRPLKFSMTYQVSVSSAPANKKDDYSLKIRFKVGLFPEIPAPPVGTNLTIKLEALLTPKITAELYMIVSSSCPVQYDAVNFANCPQLVNIGGVYEYSVDYFISRPIGDYVCGIFNLNPFLFRKLDFSTQFE